MFHKKFDLRWCSLGENTWSSSFYLVLFGSLEMLHENSNYNTRTSKKWRLIYGKNSFCVVFVPGNCCQSILTFPLPVGKLLFFLSICDVYNSFLLKRSASSSSSPLVQGRLIIAFMAIDYEEKEKDKYK